MRRVDPQQMASWLAKRERQGWSWVELSRRSGHPAWKLQWWSKRLERAPIASAARERGFVAVEVAEPARASGRTIEITTPSGYRVHVGVDFDAAHLRRVVQALEPEC